MIAMMSRRCWITKILPKPGMFVIIRFSERSCALLLVANLKIETHLQTTGASCQVHTAITLKIVNDNSAQNTNLSKTLEVISGAVPTPDPRFHGLDCGNNLKQLLSRHCLTIVIKLTAQNEVAGRVFRNMQCKGWAIHPSKTLSPSKNWPPPKVHTVRSRWSKRIPIRLVGTGESGWRRSKY